MRGTIKKSVVDLGFIESIGRQIALIDTGLLGNLSDGKRLDRVGDLNIGWHMKAFLANCTVHLAYNVSQEPRLQMAGQLPSGRKR